MAYIWYKYTQDIDPSNETALNELLDYFAKAFAGLDLPTGLTVYYMLEKETTRGYIVEKIRFYFRIPKNIINEDIIQELVDKIYDLNNDNRKNKVFGSIRIIDRKAYVAAVLRQPKMKILTYLAGYQE